MKHPQLSNHPNILSLLGFTEMDNLRESGGQYTSTRHLSLVIEYADVDSVECFLQRFGSAMIWEMKNSIICNVAAGLQALHAVDVVHNDIKASNILLFSSPGPPKRVVAKISDFGCAVLLATTKPRRAAAGTILFAAPEAYSPLCIVEPSRDVYSFALVILHISRGSSPFLGLTNEQVLQYKQDIVQFLKYVQNFLNGNEDGIKYNSNSEVLCMMRDLLRTEASERVVDLERIERYISQFIDSNPEHSTKVERNDKKYEFNPQWIVSITKLESSSPPSSTLCHKVNFLYHVSYKIV